MAATIDLREAAWWQVARLRARIKRSWLKHKTAAKGKPAKDESWEDVLLAWVVLVMGMKLAGAIFQKVVKQLLGRWRRLGSDWRTFWTTPSALINQHNGCAT